MDQLQRDQADVRKLNDIDDGLNEWEVQFAESLHAWVFKTGKPLTERQRAKLDAILEQHDV